MSFVHHEGRMLLMKKWRCFAKKSNAFSPMTFIESDARVAKLRVAKVVAKGAQKSRSTSLRALKANRFNTDRGRLACNIQPVYDDAIFGDVFIINQNDFREYNIFLCLTYCA